MRQIQASEAKTHFNQLLDQIEKGETVVITRHGRPVARIAPENAARQDDVDEAMAAIEAVRNRSRPATADEIRQWIEEGRS
jgi:prevent-host-death family protein